MEDLDFTVVRVAILIGYGLSKVRLQQNIHIYFLSPSYVGNRLDIADAQKFHKREKYQ